MSKIIYKLIGGVISLALVLSSSGSSIQKVEAAASPLNLEQQSHNVQLVGQIGGSTFAVTLQGDYAYLGVGPRLVIVDVSDPTSPAFVGQSGILSDKINDIAVANDYAYITTLDGDLHIIDVSDPTTLLIVSKYDTAHDIYRVAANGDYVYATDYWFGLHIVDVSTPTMPVLVGYYEAPGYTGDVEVVGHYAYVNADGFRIIDVSDPEEPIEVGFYDSPPGYVGYAAHIAIRGEYAYIAGTSGFGIIDISDLTKPIAITYFSMLPVNAIAVMENYVYIVQRDSGMSIFDVSDPVEPTSVGNVLTPAESLDVAVAGNFAYVADSSAGLRIIDISNPTIPAEISHHLSPGYAVAVEMVDEYVFLAAGHAGLRILDTFELNKPNEIGSSITPSWAFDVDVLEDYAYVAAGFNGLRIINTSNLEEPTEIGYYILPEVVNSVSVAGDYAYITASRHGLRIIDVMDPSSPVEVGSYNIPAHSEDVMVVSDYAYVVGSTGLRIIDISDPTEPLEVGYYASDAQCVEVVGDFVYVGTQFNLLILDVSDPTSPTEVGSFWTGANSVKVVGDYAYVGDPIGRLHLVDIKNPLALREAGYFETFGFVWDIDVIEEYVFVANGDGGLIVLRYLPHQLHLPLIFHQEPEPAVAPVRELDDGFRIIGYLTCNQLKSYDWVWSWASSGEYYSLTPIFGVDRPYIFWYEVIEVCPDFSIRPAIYAYDEWEVIGFLTCSELEQYDWVWTTREVGWYYSTTPLFGEHKPRINIYYGWSCPGFRPLPPVRDPESHEIIGFLTCSEMAEYEWVEIPDGSGYYESTTPIFGVESPVIMRQEVFLLCNFPE
jgi:hypothetical protein